MHCRAMRLMCARAFVALCGRMLHNDIRGPCPPTAQAVFSARRILIVTLSLQVVLPTECPCGARARPIAAANFGRSHFAFAGLVHRPGSHGLRDVVWRSRPRRTQRARFEPLHATGVGSGSTAQGTRPACKVRLVGPLKGQRGRSFSRTRVVLVYAVVLDALVGGGRGRRVRE